MTTHIQLLPDHIANQIAAGEVIQRPSNAVKELLENAIDAQATEIQLYIAEGGKNLIQVIDNGKGMNEVDARMCFERHATSKIQKIEDLFHIRTMGFRGEALASIAAVARVELKTRTHDNIIGTYIEIENSLIKKQESCATAIGTNIAMKNLFFNVPARRHFLKTNTTETKHIIDEFIRIAIAYPHIQFTFTNNQELLYHLTSGNLKQRIMQLFGNTYENNILAIHQESDFMKINGFVGKPKIARKTRGEQYFIVNNRFIRSPYLHHAVQTSFDNMIEADEFPFYVLTVDINPSEIDVNVHPTKQEIKFSDERLVYTFLQSSIKQALAQFSISPSIDFDLDKDIQNLSSVNTTFDAQAKNATSKTDLYQRLTNPHEAHKIHPEWRTFFENTLSQTVASTEHYNPPSSLFDKDLLSYPIQQIFGSFIVVYTPHELLIFQQSLLHQSILYKQFISRNHSENHFSKILLTPEIVTFTPSDAQILIEIIEDLKTMGYHILPIENSSFQVLAVPSFSENNTIKESLEILVEYYKHASDINSKEDKLKKISIALSKSLAIHSGMILNEEKIHAILNQWIQIEQPAYHFSGKKIFIQLQKNDIQHFFS